MGGALEGWAIDNGAWGLLAVAFLAATILPFSSEVALGGALLASTPPVEAILACSVGNCAACLLNYGLGALLYARARERLEGSWGGQRALAWIQRYGSWALLASWLPVVGDPITIVAGLVRLPLPLFAAVVLPLRILRYLVIAAPFL